MCSAVCALIVLCAALWISGLALRDRAAHNGAKEQDKLTRASKWLMDLARLSGVVAFLLILCCYCCQGVSFKGVSRVSGASSASYE